jgi:hypothetical protein
MNEIATPSFQLGHLADTSVVLASSFSLLVNGESYLRFEPV